MITSWWGQGKSEDKYNKDIGMSCYHIPSSMRKNSDEWTNGILTPRNRLKLSESSHWEVPLTSKKPPASSSKYESTSCEKSPGIGDKNEFLMRFFWLCGLERLLKAFSGFYLEGWSLCWRCCIMQRRLAASLLGFNSLLSKDVGREPALALGCGWAERKGRAQLLGILL